MALYAHKTLEPYNSVNNSVNNYNSSDFKYAVIFCFKNANFTVVLPELSV